MTIEARKIAIVQRLFNVEQKSILDKIEAILSQESILNSDQKEAIDKGLYSLENEERISNEQMLNETKTRYPNL